MEKERIGNVQFAVMAGLFTIGDTVLFVPSLVTEQALRDAWMSGILAVVAGLLLVLFYAQVGRRFPSLTMVEMIQSVLGKRLGQLVSLIYIFGFLLLVASTLLREVGDFMVTQILPSTPIHVINLLFLVLVVRAIRGGLATLARSAEIAAPWVMLLLTMLFLFVLPESRISGIEPILYDGVKPVIRGAFIFVAVPFMELSAMSMLIPYVRSPERLRRNFLLGCTIGSIMLLLVIFFCLTILGPIITKDSIYPSYLLAKKIQVGDFLQRIEAFMAIIWFFSIFFKLAICFYGICLGAAQAFELKEYRLFTFPVALVLLVFADILAPNIIAYFHIGDYYPLYTATFAVVLPLLLLLIAKLKHGGTDDSGIRESSNPAGGEAAS